MERLLRIMFLGCVVSPNNSDPQPQWFQNINTALFNSSGDFTIGGLFPINDVTSNSTQLEEPGGILCNRINQNGLAYSLVMKYAVDEINATPDLLPNIKLGFETFDTCRQSFIIVKPTMMFLTEGSSQKIGVLCNYTEYVTRVVAIIGPYTSDMADVIGKLLGFFRMPLISFGATCDKFSDKSQYPSFLRTVPSDKGLANAIVLLLKKFGWNWVAVVGSEDEYGKQGQQLFTTLAAENLICVAYQGLIPVYSDPQSTIQDMLTHIEDTKVGVVVVIAIAQAARAFFTEVINKNLSMVWIASTSWTLENSIYMLPNISNVGTVLGFIDQSQQLDLLNNYTMEFLTRLQRGMYSLPDFTFPGSPCPTCWKLTTSNISLVTQPLLQKTAFSVYLAAYSIAHALHSLLGCNATWCLRGADSKVYSWQLLGILKNITFNIKGTQFQFDSSGNPNIGYNILMWNWQDGNINFKNIGTYTNSLQINPELITWYTYNSQVPESTCSADCKPGQVRRIKGFLSCCFDCIDCKPGTFQNRSVDIQCTACPIGQWSPLRSMNCTLPTFYYLTWRGNASMGLILLAAALISCQMTMACVFVWHRGTPLMHATGGALNTIAVLSLMGGSASVSLFVIQPSDLVCLLQQPLNAFFPTVTLSAILAVALQIVCVMEFPETASSHMDIMRNPGSWVVVIACCGVQAGFCGWFLRQGVLLSYFVSSMKIDFLSQFLRCPVSPMLGFGLMYGFNGLLALVCFMSTFMAQKLSKQYNLARDVTFSTLAYCVVWVVFIPIYTGLDDESKSIAQMVAILLSNMILVGAYFLPKFYLLLAKPDLNTTDYFRTYLEGPQSTKIEESEK